MSMLCPTCGKNNMAGATICESCGSTLGHVAPATGGAVDFSPSLPSGTKLQGGQFTIGKVLGQGGFGITYKGGDMQLRRYVAIKEFFPQGCARAAQTVQPTGGMTQVDYSAIRAKFVDEARTLARFNHPGIVRVFSVFEENNTAYMIMEFLEGKTLQMLLEEKGTLPEKEAVSYILKVGEALTTVHEAKLIHRDIKPDNILVTSDNRTVLIDFGTARAYASNKTVKQTAMLTPGYAPLEQYGQAARFGSYSDVYALGATLFHCLTAQLPPQATDRATGVELRSPETINPNLSRAVSNAVMWAMQLKADARPQTMKEFLDALEGATAPAPTGTVHVTGAGATQRPQAQSPFPASPPIPTPQTYPAQQAYPAQQGYQAPQAPVQFWVQRSGEGQLTTNAAAEQAFSALYQGLQAAGIVNLAADQYAWQVRGQARSGEQLTGQVAQGPQGICITVTSNRAVGVMGQGRANPTVDGSIAATERALYQQQPAQQGYGQAGPQQQGYPQQSYAPQHYHPQGGGGRVDPAASSGQGEASSPLPIEFKRFHWGAFLMSWMWAIGHQVWIGLLCLVAGWIPCVGFIISLATAIYLGNSGYELAWQNRRWESTEHFRKVQQIWVYWGIALLIVVIIGAFILVAAESASP